MLLVGHRVGYKRSQKAQKRREIFSVIRTMPHDLPVSLQDWKGCVSRTHTREALPLLRYGVLRMIVRRMAGCPFVA